MTFWDFCSEHYVCATGIAFTVLLVVDQIQANAFNAWLARNRSMGGR